MRDSGVAVLPIFWRRAVVKTYLENFPCSRAGRLLYSNTYGFINGKTLKVLAD
jgi:hypothetical protein